MAKSALDTYRETLLKNKEMQDYMSGNAPEQESSVPELLRAPENAPEYLAPNPEQNSVSSSIEDEIAFQNDLAKMIQLKDKEVKNDTKAQKLYENPASPINKKEDLLNEYKKVTTKQSDSDAGVTTGPTLEQNKPVDPNAGITTGPTLEQAKDPEIELANQLKEAQKQRDLMAAFSTIARGAEKFGAGMAGGGLTQIKADHEASDTLKTMGNQSVEDIKSNITALLAKKKALDEQNNKARKLKTEEDKLAWDKEESKAKLDWEKEKLNAQLKSQKDLLNIKEKAKGLSLTPAQEAADKKFGAEYSEWVSLGKGNFESSKKEMESIIEELNKPENQNLSGPKISLLMKATGGAFSPNATAMKEKAQATVLNLLKSTFPGAISDSEREVMMSTAYNIGLDPKQNIEKLQTLIRTAQDRHEAKLRAVKAFEKEGTISKFSADSDTPSSTTSTSSNTVTIIDPNGVKRTVPKSEVDNLVAAGAKRI